MVKRDEEDRIPFGVTKVVDADYELMELRRIMEAADGNEDALTPYEEEFLKNNLKRSRYFGWNPSSQQRLIIAQMGTKLERQGLL